MNQSGLLFHTHLVLFSVYAGKNLIVHFHAPRPDLESATPLAARQRFSDRHGETQTDGCRSSESSED